MRPAATDRGLVRPRFCDVHGIAFRTANGRSISTASRFGATLQMDCVGGYRFISQFGNACWSFFHDLVGDFGVTKVQLLEAARTFEIL